MSKDKQVTDNCRSTAAGQSARDCQEVSMDNDTKGSATACTQKMLCACTNLEATVLELASQRLQQGGLQSNTLE